LVKRNPAAAFSPPMSMMSCSDEDPDFGKEVVAELKRGTVID
jgi:hypothetical protein